MCVRCEFPFLFEQSCVNCAGCRGIAAVVIVPWMLLLMPVFCSYLLSSLFPIFFLLRNFVPMFFVSMIFYLNYFLRF